MLSDNATVYGNLTTAECEELRSQLGEEYKFRGPSVPTSYNGVAPKATHTVYKTKNNSVVSYGEFTTKGIEDAHDQLEKNEKIYILEVGNEQ